MSVAAKLTRRAALLVAAGAALAAAAASAPAAEPLRVAAAYTVPVGQQWVSRVHRALEAARDRGDIVYVHSESVAAADYERVLRDYAEAGNDLVVGEAFALESAARRIAADYPDTAFLMGSSLGPSPPNFSVFDNLIHEPAYLTGMIAGGATRSDVVGMVGGHALPEVNRLMNAFMAGALSVNPDARFLVAFIDSWDDPPKAGQAARAMIDRGADVIYAERIDAADAARERGVRAIGNVVDSSADYPGTILASALWHMEPTVDRAVAAVVAGRFEPADYRRFSTMAYGGSSFVVDEALADAASVAAARDREREIRDGRFRVEIDDAEPRSSL
jgi:basic membrane protein A and related proteins